MAMVVMTPSQLDYVSRNLFLLERGINHFKKGRGRIEMNKIDIRDEEVSGKVCELGCDNEKHIYIIIKRPGMKNPVAVRIDQQLQQLMAS